MTTVYLVRHAEAEGNLYRRAQGHLDATITDRGYRQIAALAKRFENVPIAAAYSSDLTRTRTTALSVTVSHHLPLTVLPELREIGVGSWEDQTWAQIGYFEQEQLVLFNTDIEKWHIPGGESIDHVRERMLRALKKIIAENPDRTVAVFSHGMALRTLIGTLQGLSTHEIDSTGHAENTAVTKLECDETGIRVVYYNDASHLPDDLHTLGRQAWTKNKGGLEPGIYYLPAETDGHFGVYREGKIIGAVSIGKCENGVAHIEEYWLEDDERGKGIGIQLVGQAASYARRNGCDTLSCEIAKSNAVGLKRAREYGFTAAWEAEKSVVFTKYFGYDEEYRLKKLQDTIKENEKLTK